MSVSDSGSNGISMGSSINRRELIKITAAGAAVLTQVGTGVSFAASAYTPQFLTADEYAMTDEISEIIIPADTHSPGAKAAAVAAYIDARLADSFEPEPPRQFREGLAAVNALSQEIAQTTFLKATPEQRLSIISKMAAAEKKPETDAEKFFRDIKERTVHAYYSSKIGIHQEIGYLGNTVQQQFSGTEVK